MSCQYEKYINDMLDGKLSQSEEMELIGHAEICSRCSQRLKEIEDIDNTIREAVTYSNYRDFRHKTLQAVESNKGFTGFKAFFHKRMAYVFALAAILLAAVSMYSVKYLMNPQKPAGPNTHTQDTPTPTPSPSPDIKEPDSGKQASDEKKGINDYVTIKEVVNKEDTTPNGDKVRYIYKMPVINIDKPGAQKINQKFLDLEKDQERRIGDGQSLTVYIKSKAFLNDGIISAVMEIQKPGPGGLHAANYDIEKDKEIGTKELIERYKFDTQKLIDEINRQVKINESKPDSEKDFISIDDFVYTIADYSEDDDLKNPQEILNKSKEEKEKFVIENIDKVMAYINNDGEFVFIHTGELMDEELAVASAPGQAISPAATPKPGAGTNNIKNIKGFVPFENQSFMVDLNSWGNVKFVSGKLTAGSHTPTVFYLTDENGNILYSFEDSPFPYSVDVSAVSFTDVNKDGLKDIIIIVTDVYQGSNGKPIAAVWLQNTDGTFTNNSRLYQEINETGNNKDIKTVTDYLSKNF